MDEVLRMSHEEFVELLKSNTLGYIKSLQNLLQMQYEQCKQMKDGLLLVLQETPNMPKEDKAEYIKTKDNLYLTLQIIEDKFNIIKSFLEETKQ